MFVRIKNRRAAKPQDAIESAIRSAFARHPSARAQFERIRAGQIARDNGDALEIPDEVLAAMGSALDAAGIAKLADSLKVDPADLKKAIQEAANADAGAPPGTNVDPAKSASRTTAMKGTRAPLQGLAGGELDEIRRGLGRSPDAASFKAERNEDGRIEFPGMTPTQIRAAAAAGKGGR